MVSSFCLLSLCCGRWGGITFFCYLLENDTSSPAVGVAARPTHRRATPSPTDERRSRSAECGDFGPRTRYCRAQELPRGGESRPWRELPNKHVFFEFQIAAYNITPDTGGCVQSSRPVTHCGLAGGRGQCRSGVDSEAALVAPHSVQRVLVPRLVKVLPSTGSRQVESRRECKCIGRVRACQHGVAWRAGQGSRQLGSAAQSSRDGVAFAKAGRTFCRGAFGRNAMRCVRSSRRLCILASLRAMHECV